MNRGYVKLWRKIVDTGILQHAEGSRLLLWLFVKVSWKGSSYYAKGQTIELKPGEIIVGRKKLARELETDESTIRRAMALLAKMKIISLEVTHNWTRITLVNWEKYQIDGSRLTQEQPPSDPPSATVKEGLSLKKKKELLTADAVPVEVANAPKVQEPHLQLRDYWHAEFEKRFNRKAAFVPAKWLIEAEKSLLSQLTLDELKNRTHNCLQDGYKTNPRYVDFLKNNEDFATLRRFVVKGDPREYESKRGTFKLPPHVVMPTKSNLPSF